MQIVCVVKKAQMPGLGDVPADCVVHVLTYVGDPRSICRLGCTCWWFNDISKSDIVWQTLCRRILPPLRYTELRKLIEKNMYATLASWQRVYELETLEKKCAATAELLASAGITLPGQSHIDSFLSIPVMTSVLERKQSLSSFTSLILHDTNKFSTFNSRLGFGSAPSPSPWERLHHMAMLDLEKHGCIGQDGAVQLAVMLVCGGSIALETLSLAKQLIRGRGLSFMSVSLIECCPRITRVSLRNCRLVAPQCNDSISHIIAQCRLLTSIDLSDNQLDHSTCSAIACALQQRIARWGGAATTAAGAATTGAGAATTGAGAATTAAGGFESLMLDRNPIFVKGGAASGGVLDQQEKSLQSLLDSFIAVNKSAMRVDRPRVLSLRSIGINDGGKVVTCAKLLVDFVAQWVVTFPRISAEAQQRRPWNARQVDEAGIETITPMFYHSLILQLSDSGSAPTSSQETKVKPNKINKKTVEAISSANRNAGEPISVDFPAESEGGSGGKGEGCSVC